MKLRKLVLAFGTLLAFAALAVGTAGCKGDGLEAPIEGDGKTIIAIDIFTTKKSAGPEWNQDAMSIWGWGGNYADGNPFGSAWNGETTMLKKAPNETIYYFVFGDDDTLPVGATICFHDDNGEGSDRFNLESVTLKRGEKKVVKNGNLVVWNITYDELQD